MSRIDDELELMISRQLDGELSPEEELELNKRLIKSPAARALMEEYERNDHLAKMALRAALSPEEFRPLLQAESMRESSGRLERAVWGLGSVAAAAAVVAIVLLGPGLLKPAGSPEKPVVGPIVKVDVNENPSGLEGGLEAGRMVPLERVGPRMPFAPTHVANRRVQRMIIPVINEDTKDLDVVPFWQIERRRENLRMASGDL